MLVVLLEIEFVRHVEILGFYLVKHARGVVKSTMKHCMENWNLRKMIMAFKDARIVMRMDLYDVQFVVIKVH